MNLRTALLVVVAVGLYGCAPMRERMQPHDSAYVSCSGNTCGIEVKVNDCDAPDGITVNIPALEVRGRNVKLEWKIVGTNRFRFADNGIVIEDYDPQREFSDPKRESATEYSWRYKATPTIKRAYKYSVHLQAIESGRACRPLDPWIRN
jgi:hypothetical protein